MAKSDDVRKILRTTGIAVAAVAAAAALAALLARDQMNRHRRDLFSAQPLRRLAALGYMGGQEATIDNITLLRDYIAWEPRRLLRNRARAILGRMEEEARIEFTTGRG